MSPIHCVKILRKLFEPIQSYEMDHFCVQNGPFAPNKHFLGKIIIIFIYLLTYFMVPSFKIFLQ